MPVRAILLTLKYDEVDLNFTDYHRAEHRTPDSMKLRIVTSNNGTGPLVPLSVERRRELAAVLLAGLDGAPPAPVTGYQPCGCLTNDADAHRVGCPTHPEGKR